MGNCALQKILYNNFEKGAPINFSTSLSASKEAFSLNHKIR
jgi:hypothetical protein